jgi:hypothetical protein
VKWLMEEVLVVEILEAVVVGGQEDQAVLEL